MSLIYIFFSIKLLVHFSRGIIESGDTITLKAEVFDKNGIKCLDSVKEICFDLAGDGKLIDNLGTSKASRVVQLYNGHAYISFLKN